MWDAVKTDQTTIRYGGSQRRKADAEEGRKIGMAVAKACKYAEAEGRWLNKMARTKMGDV